MTALRNLTFLIAIFLGTHASAQFVTGTIAGGMGGAGRGAADGGEATLLNPASVAHIQRYFLGMHYHSGNYGIDGDRSNYGILLADGAPGSMIPGSFSYTKKQVDLPGVSQSMQDFAVSLAGFVHPNITLGVTGHRLLSSQIGSEDAQNNAHVGVLVTPVPWLGLGGVVYDVVDADDKVPAVARVVRTYAVGGHMMFTAAFRVRLDLVQPEIQGGYEGRRTNVMAGLETYFAPEWAFRFGNQWLETRDQTNVTTGLGYRGPRLSFDYSFQKDTRGDQGARHLVDLWLPL